MRQFRTWLTTQLGKLLLTPDYFRALAKEWLNILFGETLVGIGFLIWWALGAPTNRALVVVFVVAMFVAGYYAWRANHIRLSKRIALGDVRTIPTPTRNHQDGTPGPDRAVVQLAVECATESSIEACTARLLSVWKWDSLTSRWKATDVDEPLSLIWSVADTLQRTLEPGIPLQLNIFYVEDVVPKWIRICTDRIPFRMEQVFIDAAPDEVFKFDISVRGTEGTSAMASFRVKLNDRWDNPTIERITNET